MHLSLMPVAGQRESREEIGIGRHGRGGDSRIDCNVGVGVGCNVGVETTTMREDKYIATLALRSAEGFEFLRCLKWAIAFLRSALMTLHS